jgi:acetolactate synthase-like protein
MALEPTEKHLNPMKVLTELEEFLSDDAILVADGGDFVGTAAYILRYIYTLLAICNAKA